MTIKHYTLIVAIIIIAGLGVFFVVTARNNDFVIENTIRKAEPEPTSTSTTPATSSGSSTEEITGTTSIQSTTTTKVQ